MPGFDNDFTKFNELIPYELVIDGKNSSGFAKKTKYQIIRKMDKKIIYEYERYYGQYAKFSYWPFKFNNVWHAFIGNEYNDCQIINLDTSKIVSKLDKGDTGTGGHFCPQGFYVPSVYISTKSFYTSPERKYKVVYDENGKWKGTYNENCENFLAIDAPIRIDPPRELLLVTPDRIFNEIDDFDENNVYSSNIAYMCGVWWAADYEWLVYKIDIEQAIQTGKFTPLSETYLFNFDYGQDPDLKMFFKIDCNNSYVGDTTSVDDKIQTYCYSMKMLNEKE